MSIPGDPDTARALEILASIQRQLADAGGRLSDAAVRASGLAEQTDWRTDAATLFHASAHALRREVVSLAGDVDDAREHIGRVRSRLESGAGWWSW